MEGVYKPQVDDPSVYVGLDDFHILRHPPWLIFYSPLQSFNPTKPIPRVMLESMKTLAWTKKKREDFWIY